MKRESSVKFAALLLFLAILIFPVSGKADENYVRVTEPYAASSSEPSPSWDMSRVTTTYCDGLGRPVETVRGGAGGDFRDVAELTEYGRGGAVRRKWLPVADYGGNSFFAPSEVASLSEAFYGTERGFTEYRRDLTAEMNVTETFRPASSGSQWAEYDFCSDGEVLLYEAGGDGRLRVAGSYGEGTLRRVAVYDEDNRWTVTYTDFDGRVVAEYCGGAWTYRVYDVCGRLRYLISPEASSHLTEEGPCDEAVVGKLCTEFRYDEQDRLVYRRDPGSLPSLYVYDKTGRLAMAQDGGLQAEGRWRFLAYDSKRRLAAEGVTAATSLSREQLADALADSTIMAAAGSAGAWTVAISNLPVSSYDVTHIYYYDDYDFWTARWALPSDAAYGQTAAASRQGKPTGRAVADDEGAFTYEAVVYDAFGRAIAGVRRTDSGEIAQTTYTAYNRFGETTRERTVVEFSDPAVSERSAAAFLETGDENVKPAIVRRVQLDRTYSRLYPGMPLDGESSAVGSERESVTYWHDDIGRIVEERRSQGDRTLYAYDAESRLVSIGDNLYEEEIAYDECGLAEQRQSVHKQGTERRSLLLSFDYDARRFLTASDCLESPLSAGLFTERMDYDLNGNILSLQRGASAALVQDAKLYYDGNRVTSVDDSSDDLTTGAAPRFPSGSYDAPLSYDAMGRVTADALRGVASVAYNLRSLPREVEFDDGNTLTRLYDADGVKLLETDTTRRITIVKQVIDGKIEYVKVDRSTHRTTQYCGPVEREDGDIRKVHVGGRGFWLCGTDGQWAWHRYVKNHLGSIAAVAGEDGTAVQRVWYFASGLPVTENAATTAVNSRLHIGKEFTAFDGLWWYDNDARQYDPLTMRFTTLDPLAANYPSLSPYAYCANNPVNYIDPDGEAIETVWDIANAVYDLGAALVNHYNGNHQAAVSNWIDFACDMGAVLVPGVPAGGSKIVKAGSTKVKKAGTNVVKSEKPAVSPTKRMNYIRQKAVKDAWKQEQEMVKKTGKGTRKWTKEQKAELLEKGKVKGFQGHHINNVKDHPELAGNPDNIEFLTRKEHLDRHGGNFRNETHGKLLNRKIKE